MIVRLEDLHEAPETVMKKLAEYVAIDYNKILLNSTIGGTPYVFSGPNNRNVSGQNISVVQPKYKNLFSEEEIRIIETVYKEFIFTCGYEFQTEANFSLNEAKQVLGEKVSTSIFHPKFFILVNERHYQHAVSVHQEAVGSSLGLALIRRRGLKAVLVLTLDLIGLGRSLYTVLNYRNKIREFRKPSMKKIFQFYNTESNRLKLFASIFE